MRRSDSNRLLGHRHQQRTRRPQAVGSWLGSTCIPSQGLRTELGRRNESWSHQDRQWWTVGDVGGPPTVRATTVNSRAVWTKSVARWAHNPEVAGSNPVPAPKWNGTRRRLRGPFWQWLDPSRERYLRTIFHTAAQRSWALAGMNQKALGASLFRLLLLPRIVRAEVDMAEGC